ncbi:MAG: TolC family protein, partial [Deinococcales bacterium]|nr:TolC family protein [Chitinophagaceae bacterium]
MMKQKTQPITLLCMVLLLATGSFAQVPRAATKHAFTIQQAVDYAGKNNVQVKNALLNLK